MVVGHEQKKGFLWSVLVLAAIFLGLQVTGWAQGTVQDGDLWRNAQDQIADLSAQQKSILSSLLDLILQMSDQERQVKAGMDDVNRATAKEQGAAQSLETALLNYQNAWNRAADAVRLLQQMGPGSFWQVVLEANSLRDLLHRVDLVVLLAGGIERSLHELQGQLASMKQLENRAKQVRQELEKQLVEQENRLAALQETQQHLQQLLEQLGQQQVQYQRQAEQLEADWGRQARDWVSLLPAGLAQLVGPETQLDGVRSQITAAGILLSVPWSALNSLLDNSPQLHGSRFLIQDEQVVLAGLGGQMEVIGYLAVNGSSAVQLVIKQARFQGITIPAREIQDLLADQLLLVDFSSLLLGMQLRSISVNGQTVELVLGYPWLLPPQGGEGR